MLSSAFNPIGFSWASSPSLTELEMVVVDWWAKMIHLPKHFLTKTSNPESDGGGSLHGSASEAIYTAMMAARFNAIKTLKDTEKYRNTKHDSEFLPLLVAYTSTEAHSSVEKAAMMSLVKYRILEPDDKGSLRGETLKKAVDEDVKNGLIPFYVCATLGTTGGCFFDNIRELGEVCKQHDTIWLHVDGAYAGNSFVCEENHKWLDGMEYADSFNTNANKFMLTNFDCSGLWARDIKKLCEGFVIDPVYLHHDNEKEVIDLRHYGNFNNFFNELILYLKVHVGF
jgi:glutamate/tyrosine decarboxylase-like PLP-dependent enzyme